MVWQILNQQNSLVVVKFFPNAVFIYLCVLEIFDSILNRLHTQRERERKGEKERDKGEKRGREIEEREEKREREEREKRERREREEREKRERRKREETEKRQRREREEREKRGKREGERERENFELYNEICLKDVIAESITLLPIFMCIITNHNNTQLSRHMTSRALLTPVRSEFQISKRNLSHKRGVC